MQCYGSLQKFSIVKMLSTSFRSCRYTWHEHSGIEFQKPALKFLEKENIPADIKSVRLQYLENQQQTLLDRLDKLKAEDNSAENL